jgi:multidrug efflux system membrane fusion protein
MGKLDPGRAERARRTLFALGTLLLSACSNEIAPPPEPRAVIAVRVSVGTQSGEVAYSGEVRPRYETALSFRVPGKIVARVVDMGNAVEKGRVLARLDPEDQQLNEEAAKSQLAVARADYEQAKADLTRYAGLLEQKFISEAEFDRRRTTYDVAKARLEQARAQLGVVRNQAAYTELRADHAGVITAIQAEVGQVVAAGQAVMRLARTGEKEIEISIPENKLGELSAAREIAITLWAAPEKTYRGRVREVSPSADTVTRTYAARISAVDPDPEMKLGMTANVFLRGIARGVSVELPATAVFRQGDRAAVWLIDPASKQVKAVAVEVGGYYEDKVSIRSGLKEGDLVVRAGVHKLFEGEKIRVLEAGGA